MSRLSTNTHPLLVELVIEALNSKQIFTVNDFLKKDTGSIIRYTRLTFSEVLELRKCLVKQYTAPRLNGLKYFQLTMQKSAIIPTGIKSVDRLLDGGLVTGNIYELSGLPASGKTLFCLTLIKNATVNLNQSIYYLDTKNNFVGMKLKQLLNGLSDEKCANAMKNCFIKRAHTKYSLISNMYAIKNELESYRSMKSRIIIVDSLSAVFLQHSMDHSENNNLLTHLVNCMHYLMCEYHVTFLITNLITHWHDLETKNDIETVACGRYWTNIPNYKLKIQMNDRNSEISLLKGPGSCPLNNKTVINVAENGLLY